jgi:hypothetical protein
MRGWSITLGLLAAIMALPAAAQQKTPPVEFGAPPVTGSLTPSDSGKPMTLTPPPIAIRPDDTPNCIPGLPCGTHLTGAVQKNGAVAIEFPALKW